MTTATLTPSALAERPAHRALAVARLIVANPWTTLITPWAILLGIFALNYAIWAILFRSIPPEAAESAREGIQFSGGTLFVFVYMLVVAVSATTQTFSLSLGWGATRRDFSIGSGLVWVALSLLYAAGMTLLGLLEEVTGGWGLGGTFFTGVYFGDGPWWSRFPIIVAFLLFFFALGSATAAAYVRWRQNGMYVFFALLALFLVGSAAALTLTGSWPAVGQAILALGVGGLAAWSLVPTVVMWVLGWLILRRATPQA